MVEFALLNIVLIPLLLYAIFLMDAAYLKLDLQETVVAGVWDFSQRNSEPPGGTSGVTASNSHTRTTAWSCRPPRRPCASAYADHTSAFDDGGEMGPTATADHRATRQCDAPRAPRANAPPHQLGARTPSAPSSHRPTHERASGGHALVRGSRAGHRLDTQFKCRSSNDMGWNPDPNFHGFGNSGYTAGAEVRCDSIGFIYNYIIPETFLQEFSKAKRADEE